MTPAEFKQKWSRYTGKETSAYQGQFDDLCRLLGRPTPAAADPIGSEWFCFQKRVVKDAELFALKEDGSQAEAGEEAERGFADVWEPRMNLTKSGRIAVDGPLQPSDESLCPLIAFSVCLACLFRGLDSRIEFESSPASWQSIRVSGKCRTRSHN